MGTYAETFEVGKYTLSDGDTVIEFQVYPAVLRLGGLFPYTIFGGWGDNFAAGAAIAVDYFNLPSQNEYLPHTTIELVSLPTPSSLLTRACVRRM